MTTRKKTKTRTDRARLAAPTTGCKPKDTKKAQLIRMLSGKACADIGTISGKLGWQSHTTRAAITGLRKAGYAIAAKKPGEGGPTRYRITAEPPNGSGAVEPTVSPERVDAG